MSDVPARKPRLPLHLAIAYALGVGTGGVAPPVFVDGAAPADAPGWVCETVGPRLNARIVCRFEEDGWGRGMGTFEAPGDCGWRETKLPDGTLVSAPKPCRSNDIPTPTRDTIDTTTSGDGGTP